MGGASDACSDLGASHRRFVEQKEPQAKKLTDQAVLTSREERQNDTSIPPPANTSSGKGDTTASSRSGNALRYYNTIVLGNLSNTEVYTQLSHPQSGRTEQRHFA
jgi:hypothetical protein